MRRPRVLFCGLEFEDGYAHTRAYVDDNDLDVDVARCAREDVAREISRCDVAVPLMTKLDAELLKIGAAGALTHVLQFGVGLEGVDIECATALGVTVARIPSEKTGNATSTAELAVYLVLAALRRHDAMSASVRSRKLGAPTGNALSECEVMILGWGAIGVKIAARLRGFECALTAARKSKWAEDESDRCGIPLRAVCATSDHDEFRALLRAADVVCVACTQDPSNAGMIDDEFLAAMKPGAALVNIARGGLFDRDAVLKSLKSGHLGYLASDVAWSEPVDPEDPIVRHEHTYFTPHIAGVTHSSYRMMGEIVATSASRLVEFRKLTDIQVVN